MRIFVSFPKLFDDEDDGLWTISPVEIFDHLYLGTEWASRNKRSSQNSRDHAHFDRGRWFSTQIPRGKSVVRLFFDLV